MKTNDTNALDRVSQALRDSKEALRLNDIMAATGLPEDAVRAAMRILGQAAQVEVLHGGRSGNRYAWLSSKQDEQDGPKPVTQPAATVEDELVEHLKTVPAATEPSAYPQPSEGLRIPDAPVDARYLVCVPKHKPRVMKCAQRARQATLAAVRNGAPRAEVFVLVPYGIARPGAQWNDANRGQQRPDDFAAIWPELTQQEARQ